MLVADALNHERATSSPSDAIADPMSKGGARSLDVSILPVDAELARTDWMAMFQAAPDANPYQHPDYVLAELAYSPVRSKVPAVVLRAGSVSTCAGVGVLVPKTVRTSQVGGIGLGWTTRGFRLVGGTFLTAEASVEIQSKLLDAALRHCAKAGAEFLLIEDLDDQSTLAQAIQQAGVNDFRQFSVRESQPRWRIQFPPNADDYWNSFSGRTRRAFRVRLKKFSHSRLTRVSEVEQVPAFLSAAHEISKQSWQSRQFGLRIRNDECELQRLRILAQQGFLRSYVCDVDGKPAAFALCHQHGNCFHYEEIAYCAEYGPFSPGETMLQQIIEDLFQHETPQYLDFGGGDAEYKRKFGNHESRSQTLWLVPPTWRASATLSYLNACRGVKAIVRRATNACGLATRARQWIRNGASSAPPKVTPDDASHDKDDADASARMER